MGVRQSGQNRPALLQALALGGRGSGMPGMASMVPMRVTGVALAWLAAATALRWAWGAVKHSS